MLPAGSQAPWAPLARQRLHAPDTARTACTALRRYCDGSSHQARDPYRRSPFDTGLLILQTSAAAARWRVTPTLVQQLQTAMAACVPSAAAVERQRKQRGQNDLEWRGLVPPARQAPAPA